MDKRPHRMDNYDRDDDSQQQQRELSTRDQIAAWRGNRRQRRVQAAHDRRLRKLIAPLVRKLGELRAGQSATSADLQREAEYLVGLGHNADTID